MAVTIATLQAKITADTSGFQAGMARVVAAIGNMSRLGSSAGASFSASFKGASGTFRKLADSGAAQTIGRNMTLIGGAGVAAIGLLVRAGSEVETTFANVAGNTNMTAKQFAFMESAVKSLAANTSAPISQLADGYMHIANYGYQGAAAMAILNAAQRSAVSTGGDAGATARMLAAVMHEFKIPVGQAAEAMNVLHTAAAKGDMTLEEMVASGGPALGFAANLGVKLTNVAAAMSALTQHGFDAARASTQVLDMMAHISHPSSIAEKALRAVSKASGIDLVEDFSAAGIKGKQLSGVLEDVSQAATKLKIPRADLIQALIPAQRGGIGALALTGTAAGDFAARQTELGAAAAGKTDATGPAFARAQKKLSFQIGVMRNNLALLGSTVESALIPALNPLINGVTRLVQMFARLPAPAQRFVIVAAAIGSALTLALGGLIDVGAQIATLAAAFADAGVTAAAATSAIATLTAPALAVGAAIALLAIAWKNDFAGIREAMAPLIKDVSATFAEMRGPIAQFSGQVMPLLRAFGAEVTPFFRTLFQGLGVILRDAWDYIKAIVGGALEIIAGVIRTVLGLLTLKWSAAWDGIKEIFAGVWSAIAGIIDTAAPGLLAGIENLGENIAAAWHDAVSTLISEFGDGGRSIIEAFVAGITSGASSLASEIESTATGIGRSLESSLKSSLGIASPSRVTEKIGEQTGAGFVAGLTKSRAAVHREVSDLLDQLLHTNGPGRHKVSHSGSAGKSYIQQLATERAQLAALQAGLSPAAASVAGKYHALSHKPSALEGIADQLAGLKSRVAELKSFSAALAAAKSEIARLRNGETASGAKAAAKFADVPAAARARLQDALAQIAAIKAVREARSALANFHTDIGDKAQAAAAAIAALNQTGADPQTAAWLRYLDAHKQLAKALANNRASAASARREFDDMNTAAARARGLGALSKLDAGYADKPALAPLTNLDAANAKIAAIIQADALAPSQPVVAAMLDRIRAAADRLDLAKAGIAFAKLSDSLTATGAKLASKLAGTYDPAQAALSTWLDQNRSAIAELQAVYGEAGAAPKIAALQSQFLSNFANTDQLAGVDQVRTRMADLRRQIAEATAKTPFERLKAELSTIDLAGDMTLPPGITDDSIRQLAALQTQLDAIKQSTRDAGNEFTGFAGSLSGSVGNSIGQMFTQMMDGRRAGSAYGGGSHYQEFGQRGPSNSVGAILSRNIEATIKSELSKMASSLVTRSLDSMIKNATSGLAGLFARRGGTMAAQGGGNTVADLLASDAGTIATRAPSGSLLAALFSAAAPAGQGWLSTVFGSQAGPAAAGTGAAISANPAQSMAMGIGQQAISTTVNSAVQSMVAKTATQAATQAAGSAAGQSAVAAGTSAGMKALSAAVPWIAAASVLSNPAAVRAIGDAISSIVQGVGKAAHSVISAFTGADAPRIQNQTVQSQHNNMMLVLGGGGFSGNGKHHGGLLGGILGGVLGGGGLGGILGGMFADGGDPPLGKISLVGERGPELFVPRSAGTIIPNHALRATNGTAPGSAGRQSVNVVINHHGDVHGIDDVAALYRSIGDSLAWTMRKQLTTATAGT